MSSKLILKLALPLIVISGFLVACDNASENVTTDMAESSTAATPESDAIPGFGVTPKSALRDDTIALWEAYQREVIVQKCMQTAKISYNIEVAFPVGVAVSVADNLVLPDAHDLERSGVELGTLASISAENFEQAMNLPSAEKENYFQHLYGESAADVELVQSTGELPHGRDDFARGGCVGESWNEIPGVYVLKRSLAPAIDSARRLEISRASAPEDISGPCAGAFDSSANLLAAKEGDLSRQSVAPISAECENFLTQRSVVANNTAIQRVLSNRTARTRSHVGKYSDAMKTLNKDSQFLEFLAASTHGVAATELLDKALDLDE